MSGTVRVRKQWQIQEGPRGTLRKLRNQLAEDGCVESQVVIAKHLLEEAQDSGSWTERTTQAVHWLMKASEQGNEEATSLLRNCFNSGAGITEENFEEVKTCLKMSDEEKAFRCAARDIFSRLTPFGQEFITTSQLRAKLAATKNKDSQVGSLAEKEDGHETDKKDEANKSFSRWYQESSLFDGEHLTEDKLADIAGKISQGELPSVSLSQIGLKQRQGRLFVKRAFHTIKEGLEDWSSRSLQFVAQHGDRFLLTLLPWGQLRVVTFVLLCSFLPLETVFYLLPLITFYAALLVMVCSSLQLVNDQRRLHIFVEWLRIFSMADATLPTLTAERNFCFRRLHPYLRFLISTGVFLCSYPLCDGHTLPHSEISAICGSFAILCLIGLSIFTPPVVAFMLLSCLMTALRLACVVNMEGSSVLGVLFTGWKITLMDQVIIHLTLAKLLVILFLATCLWMAITEHWHGFYKLLLPNMVIYTWLQLLVIFFPYATWTGICQGAVLLATALVLPVVLVVVGLSFLLRSMVGLVNYMAATVFSVRLLVTCGIILITVVGKWLVDRRERLSSELWKKWLTRIQIVCGICAALQFIPAFPDLSFSSYDPETRVEFLDWQVYQQSCHQPAWNEFTMARVQDYCSHLQGAHVAWQGQVKRVKIKSVRNRLEEALEVLPEFVADRLRCIYGSPYEACSIDDMSVYHFRLCSTVTKVVKHKCHIKEWNLYSFEIAVQIGGGYWNSAEVFVVADDNAFRDFVFHLNAGDEIKFTGLLQSNAGGVNPTILLKSLTCEDCAYSMDPAVNHQQVNLYDKFHVVYNFVFSFFFHPFMGLKHPHDKT